MKKQFIFFVILSLTIVTSCCHKKKLSKQNIQNNSSAIVDGKNIDEYLKFEAHYLHTTEATYEEVKIKDGKISYTYFKDAKGNQVQSSDQKNIWTTSDLNTKEADLAKQDIDSLSIKIDQYNFWKLDSAIGNPTTTDHYYLFELSFNTASKQKNVIFKSVPGGITMPMAFMKSRDELMKLARKKITF